jgi:hypothetical protein
MPSSFSAPIIRSWAELSFNNPPSVFIYYRSPYYYHTSCSSSIIIYIYYITALKTTRKKKMSKSDPSPETARSRLAVLTAHLVGATKLESSSSSINRSCVSAQVSPPGNLRGALTVIDERTGKKYQIPVSQDGTVKASDFKKVYFIYFLIVAVVVVDDDFIFNSIFCARAVILVHADLDRKEWQGAEAVRSRISEYGTCSIVDFVYRWWWGYP